jgi:hypothetical protein
VVLLKPMVAHAILPAVGLAVKVLAYSTLVSVGVSMPIMALFPPNNPGGGSTNSP